MPKCLKISFSKQKLGAEFPKTFSRDFSWFFPVKLNFLSFAELSILIFSGYNMATKEDLLWVGLSESKAAETLKNAKLTETIGSIIKTAKAAGASGEISKQKGTLLYQLATKLKPQVAPSAPLVVKYIVSEGIKSETQVGICAFSSRNYLFSFSLLPPSSTFCPTQ